MASEIDRDVLDAIPGKKVILDPLTPCRGTDFKGGEFHADPHCLAMALARPG